MLTYIYRSEKKADCYIYLNKTVANFDLPIPVRKVLGDLVLVMELDVEPETKLALSDPEKVLSAIEDQGFYIQMPSKEPHPVDLLFDKLFDKA